MRNAVMSVQMENSYRHRVPARRAPLALIELVVRTRNAFCVLPELPLNLLERLVVNNATHRYVRLANFW
ncbi:hypothetical protein GCK32_017999 [Trichostrongylus colubriformis]|uniref:Uncharacterized protein n=1 Tax=Trichostrongylus colubriformis TaxID=6319 RepID=A0AAN8F6V2_TRICO